VAIGSNVFDHNPDYDPNELCTGIRLVDSVDCALTGVTIQDCQAGRHTVRDAGPQERQALVEVVRCRRIALTGCQVFEGAPAGIAVADSSEVLIQGCQVLDGRSEPLMQHAIRWTGEGANNLIAHCQLGGTVAPSEVPKHVRQWDNQIVATRGGD
jgi:hypothetical protein